MENVPTMRLATEAELAGVLGLQSENLLAHLSERERGNGFVTTPFSAEQLHALVEQDGLFVAASPGQIVGYTMAAGWDYFAQWPIFPFMIDRFAGRKLYGTEVTLQSTFQYGPVCVATSLRGSDAFPRIFEAMRLELRERFPVGITFINRANERSFRAHTEKVGLDVIDEFEFGDQGYYALAFDTARSVL